MQLAVVAGLGVVVSMLSTAAIIVTVILYTKRGQK